MTDIPDIITTPGSGTTAPAAATNTINPDTDYINNFNDVVLPLMQSEISTLTTQLATANANITSLQAAVAALSGGASIVMSSVYGTWDPTGVLDCSAALQAGMNAATGARLPLLILPGEYLITKSVLTCNLMNQSQSLVMIGVGPQPGSANTLANSGRNPFVIFNSTVTNGPTFEMTGGFNCWYENFTIVGPNKIPQFMFPNFDGANYVNAGIRDSQFSPCVGFGVDSMNSAVPSDGGFQSTAADGTSMVSKYSASHSPSSNCMFRNVSLCNFVAGVTITLSGNGSLTDQFTFDRCNVTINKVNYVSCQPQSKIHRILGGDWGSAQTLFDGTSYGIGQGCAPIEIAGLNVGNCLRMFNFGNQTSPTSFHDCYGESFRSFGVYCTNAASSNSYATFKNMPATLFTGSAQGYPGPIPLPPLIFESAGAVTKFDSTSFGINNGSVYSWNFAMGAGSGTPFYSPMVFDNCGFKSPAVGGLMPLVGPDRFSGSIATLINCGSNGTFPNLPMSDYSTNDVSTFTYHNRAALGPRAARYANGTGLVEVTTATESCTLSCTVSALTLNSTTVTLTSNPASGSTSGTMNSSFNQNTGIYLGTFNSGTVRHCIAGASLTKLDWINNPLTASETAATVSLANTSLTFTAADPTLFLVGDLLYWQMLPQGGSTYKRQTIGWVVSAISGSTITCTPTCEATQYDSVANQPSTTTVYLAQYQWAPSGSAITASVTSGSATITSVSPANALVNGDWLKDSVSGGAGILATNSRVVSGAGTGTLVLNKNATSGSPTTTTLYYARLGAPTLTAPW